MVKYNKNKKIQYLFHAPPSYPFFSILVIFTVDMSEYFVQLEISKYFSLVMLLAFSQNFKPIISCKNYVINE